MVSLQWMNSIVRLSVIVQSMPVLMGLQKDGLWTFYKLSLTGQRHFLNLLMRSPVLKICFGPPTAENKNLKNHVNFDVGDLFFRSPALWSSQNVFGPPTAGRVVVDFKDRDRPSPSSFWLFPTLENTGQF